MSTCKNCGGEPIECGVCNADIEGECEGADACEDGGAFCGMCRKYVHPACVNLEADCCRKCALESRNDERDERREIYRCLHR